MAEKPLYFLVAGEASGDLLGARLMKAMRAETNGAIRFAGIGGERMLAEGLELLFPYNELAHMGLIELISYLPNILRRLRETIATIYERQPEAVITIDAPDFSFRVAKGLRKKGYKKPLIHYVAPSVWAWRPQRARHVASLYDHLLALLPFEPPYFTKEKLPCTFVGHSLIESGADKGSGTRFRRKFKLDDETPLLMLLPGSRAGEIKRLLPIFKETVFWLRTQDPTLAIVVPTVPTVAGFVRREVQSWGVPVIFTDNDTDKYDAMAASTAALACSGTITVELAMAGLPSVIAYRINSLTYAIYKRLIHLKFATLINILEDRMVMPEFLQDECTPKKLALAVFDLFTNPEAREAQKKDLKKIAGWLGQGEFVPSHRAAQTVLSVAESYREGKR